jgi:hypothetical protein
MMNAYEYAAALELNIVVVRRALGRKVLGQLSPLAAGSEHVENAVDERAVDTLRSGGRNGSISANSSLVKSLSYRNPLRS